jgi:hypothetical protein
MAKKSKKEEKIVKSEEIQPLMVSDASTYETKAASYGSDSSDSSHTQTRRNVSADITRTDRYRNIDSGLIPFRYSTGISNSSNMNVRDAVILCQKCYYNFAVFRNTIDLMTEFSCSNIYFKGGSQKSRDFFSAWLKKINIFDLLDQFFREYYRSGNVFIYRFDTKIKPEDVNKITQTFGLSAKAADVMLPARYNIINPADVQLGGTINFSVGRYYKILTDYELERLKAPKTPEDKEVLESLPIETQRLITKTRVGILTLPLDRDRLCAVFYKKQDYEPFAVPMGFPVLEDINWKAEMKKMDMSIARTMQQIVLLVTMGTDPDKGGVNQKNLEAMQNLFTNQSVGRVLIADYTTKAQFVIPEIGNLMGPEKYEVVDRDILVGLNNILIGNDKFANGSMKVQVFIERLKQSRESFLNNFLYPEIRRISRDLGFKNYPTPFFEDIDLKDDVQYSRIFTRLMELGILTPEEGLAAIESGKLPQTEESIASQEKFRELKDQGLYQPLIGGAKIGSEPGRPSGSTGIPQSTKNINPKGQGKQSKASLFNIEKIKDNFVLASRLQEKVEASLRERHSLRKLSKQQKEVAFEIVKIIASNENPEVWDSVVNEYVKNPKDKNLDKISNIESIAIEHGLDTYVASILYHSKKSEDITNG